MILLDTTGKDGRLSYQAKAFSLEPVIDIDPPQSNTGWGWQSTFIKTRGILSKNHNKIYINDQFYVLYVLQKNIVTKY